MIQDIYKIMFGRKNHNSNNFKCWYSFKDAYDIRYNTENKVGLSMNDNCHSCIKSGQIFVTDLISKLYDFSSM